MKRGGSFLGLVYHPFYGQEWCFLFSILMEVNQYLKPHVLRDANQPVLNCEKFSQFWTFTHGINTQNTTHSYIFIYLYKGHSTSTSLVKEEESDKESSNKWHRKEAVQPFSCLSCKFFYLLFFCNSTLPLLFLTKLWWYYSKQQQGHIQEPISVSEVTLEYLHKIICNSNTLLIWVVYPYVCL